MGWKMGCNVCANQASDYFSKNDIENRKPLKTITSNYYKQFFKKGEKMENVEEFKTI